MVGRRRADPIPPRPRPELLHKHRDASSTPHLDRGARPGQIERPRPMAGFPSTNDPGEPTERVPECPAIEVHRSERRLVAHPPYRGRRLEQQRDPLVSRRLVLDRDAEPNMIKDAWQQGWREELRDPLLHPLRPLRENLVGMLIGFEHHVEDLLDPLVLYLLVEQIAHTVHEDPARLLPPKREVER